jgi:1-acyl-sn-glycerol-3-phosphate acyltransferase
VTALLKHPIRVTARLLWFAAELVLIALNFALRCWFRPQQTVLGAKTRWLQQSSRRTLRILSVHIKTSGPVPTNGLLISNHLSYLDILVLSTICAPVFVSKYEVKFWPVFGWFASMAGTVFVRRDRRTHVSEIADKMKSVLNQKTPLVLFPEGTSSNGQTVLPFKTSLLEPAASQAHPLSVSLIEYQLDDGDVGEEVCYWRDMTLMPHLINLLSKRAVRTHVHFKQIHEHSSDRKELARQLHAELLKLKEPVLV